MPAGRRARSPESCPGAAGPPGCTRAPAHRDTHGDGQREKLTSPPRTRPLAALRCAAPATEVSAALPQMCAGHPASATGKLHPKSKVGSEGGVRSWTAGLPARELSCGSGARGGRGPAGNFLTDYLPNHCVLLSPLPAGAAASALSRVPVCQRSRPGEESRREAASKGETGRSDTRSGRPGCARTGPAAADGRRQRSLADKRLGAWPLDRLPTGGCSDRSDARGGPVAALQ